MIGEPIEAARAEKPGAVAVVCPVCRAAVGTSNMLETECTIRAGCRLCRLKRTLGHIYETLPVEEARPLVMSILEFVTDGA